MAHGMPPRHGVDWNRAVPTPSNVPSPLTTPAGRIQAGMVGSGVGTPYQEVPGAECIQKLPVKVLDAYFQNLPDPNIQPIVKSTEARWDSTKQAGSSFALVQFTVPQAQVYVLTDIFYYAQSPSSLLEGPPISLDPEALTGIVRFELTFSGRQPLRIDSAAFDPYAAVTATVQQRSGWPLLGTAFGTRRGAGFALYARSQQEVLVKAFIDSTPRFVITKVGAHMHGFTVPEAIFDQLFVKPTACLPLGSTVIVNQQQQQAVSPLEAGLRQVEAMLETVSEYSPLYPQQQQYDQYAYDVSRQAIIEQQALAARSPAPAPSVVVAPTGIAPTTVPPELLSRVTQPAVSLPSYETMAPATMIQPTVAPTSRETVSPLVAPLPTSPLPTLAPASLIQPTAPTSRETAETYSPYIYNPTASRR